MHVTTAKTLNMKRRLARHLLAESVVRVMYARRASTRAADVLVMRTQLAAVA